MLPSLRSKSATVSGCARRRRAADAASRSALARRPATSGAADLREGTENFSAGPGDSGTGDPRFKRRSRRCWPRPTTRRRACASAPAACGGGSAPAPSSSRASLATAATAGKHELRRGVVPGGADDGVGRHDERRRIRAGDDTRRPASRSPSRASATATPASGKSNGPRTRAFRTPRANARATAHADGGEPFAGGERQTVRAVLGTTRHRDRAQRRPGRRSRPWRRARSAPDATSP